VRLVVFFWCLLLLAVTAEASTPGESASSASEARLGEVRLGWSGVYKLGCWTPLQVEVLPASEASAARVPTQIAVTVSDTDATPTTLTQPLSAPLTVRIGRARSTVEVRLLDQNEKILSQRTLYTHPDPDQGADFLGLPATNRLILVFGSKLDLEALSRSEGVPKLAETRILWTDRADEMPQQWYGYEGIDTVVLTTSQPETIRPLLENAQQVEALQQWVRLGGKLVVFCGSEGAQLLQDNGPLSPLVSGRYAEMLTLRQSSPLEAFIGSERSIRGRFELQVPWLKEVRGRVLAFAGRDAASGAPLVVQTQQGFGRRTLVAFDFQRAPLLTWRGRTSFLRRVFDWPASDLSQQRSLGQSYAAGESDLTVRLRSALDEQFPGITTISFALVAVLMVALIALIGPGDYFLLKKVFRRMELTWITFPLAVVGVSAASYWLAHTMKGDQLRTSQLEIVDIDTTTGLARGTAWTHFFNPHVNQFDLKFVPRFSGNQPLTDSQTLVAWQGVAGSGLGGMQAEAGQSTTGQRTGYRWDLSLGELQQLPVKAWSTKTLTARWTATVRPGIEAQLQRVSEEVVTGHIANRGTLDLKDCLLLYGNWAFPLGDLAAGESAEIDEEFARPRTVRQALTDAQAGDQPVTRIDENDTVRFNHRRTDVARIAKAMMFYQAIRGKSYTHLYHRYQSYIDLSHVLANGQALLLARCPASGSHWTSEGATLGGKDDPQWTYYRFLLPVVH